MRYRINWTETVDYYTYVEAESPEAAVAQFKYDPSDFDTEEVGYGIDDASIAATEDPE